MISSREEAEELYSPSRWSKKFRKDEIIPHHIQLCEKRSSEARLLAHCELNVTYGTSTRQKLDIFYPEENDIAISRLPVFMLVHGGYWQELNKNFYSYVCSDLAKKGIIGVSVGYDLCPEVKVSDIVNQVKSAVSYVCAKFCNSPICVGGHSAGAHLTSMLLSDNYGPIPPISGVIPISGVFDLQPLVDTYINEALGMTNEEALSLSSMYITPVLKCKALVIVGGDESPAFIKQSFAFHEHLVNAGIASEYMLVDKEDHFSIMEVLVSEGSSTLERIVQFVKSL